MLQMFLGGVIISFAAILVKLSSLNPTMIGFYRTAIGFFVMLAIELSAHSTRGISLMFRDSSIRRPILKWSLLSGFCFALDLFVWHKSIKYIGAGPATLLGNTQVFYLIAFGAFLFRERFSKLYYVAVTVAFLGIYLLVGSKPVWVSDHEYVPGIIFGLLTGICYASYLISLRYLNRIVAPVSPMARLLPSVASTALIILVMSLIEGTYEKIEGMNWAWMILLAAGPQVLGSLWISRGMAVVSLSLSGLILLIQPALAIFWGKLFFSETLSRAQYLGAAMAMCGIGLGSFLRGK